MSTPVIETILANIVTTANTVTTANGFNQNLNAFRPTKQTFANNRYRQDGNVLVMMDVVKKSAGQVISGIEWDMTVRCEAIVLGTSDSEVLETRINQVRADIEKKLLEDVNRGGNAEDTIILDPEYFSEGPEITGVVVNILINFRTQLTDPYIRL